MRKSILAGVLCLCFTGMVWSQNHEAVKSKKQNYTKNPVWIQMMDDPHVNYFEANKAFEQFWSNREKPEIEGEGSAEQKDKEEKRSLLSRLVKSDKAEEAERHEYAISYKRFVRWRMEVEPFVQSDGSVLSLDEQRLIWEKSRQ
jgi:hypothetical protein